MKSAILRRVLVYLWCLIPLGVIAGEWVKSAVIVGLFTIWVGLFDWLYGWVGKNIWLKPRISKKVDVGSPRP